MATEADILLPVIGKLPTRWRAVEFGAVLEGGTRNGIYKSKEFHGRGQKMVNMGELFGHPRLRNVEMRRVELDEKELERFSIMPGDLLFARRSLVAEGAGKCCIVLEANETTTFESSIIRARPNPREANSLFLFYLFKSPFGTHVLGSILRHVAVAGITGSDLVKLRVPIPPLAEQRAIAQILNALDEKIELNRRMNQTLEALAQTIFKSWFVDAVATKLPKGWHFAKISELCEINSWTLGKNDDLDRIEYVEISEVSRGNISNIQVFERGNEPSRARRRLRHGDTVLSTVRPDRGAYFLCLNPSPSLIASTGFAVLTPTKAPWSFIHAAMTQPEVFEYLGQHADGGAYPAVHPEIIGKWTVPWPKESEILESFHNVCAPLYERAEHNRQESRTLAELRDALLPKLLSGELRVPAGP
jgi:type I restriction enzyme, S subunit